MSKKLIPVTLLTGYLGAGKTTLINYILTNQKGYKVAVIVNDIGEVNVDASLIAKGGMVQEKDENLVPLTNGCICCTLKYDLIEQIQDLAKTGRFDYILIEASGICEPIPIAQTLTMLDGSVEGTGLPELCKLDNVVTVVDALRLRDEFLCGDSLLKEDIDDEDIENLLIQQIEFCNTIVLNKVDCLDEKDLEQVRAVVRTLQPSAKIIETNYAKVDIEDVMATGAFDFDAACAAPGWVQALNEEVEEEHHDHDHDHEEEHHHEHHDHDEDHRHCDHDHEDHGHEEEGHEEHGHGHHHHHHHHHDHEGGEVEEYGIGTFVYYRRRGFDRDKLTQWVEKWPGNIIRCKGVLWFTDEADMAYIFEQAGRQITAESAGKWLASAPKAQQQEILAENQDVLETWDSQYGDRMVKLVFIGQKMNKQAIMDQLDACLGE
jgi:G3E family GTPase